MGNNLRLFYRVLTEAPPRPQRTGSPKTMDVKSYGCDVQGGWEDDEKELFATEWMMRWHRLSFGGRRRKGRRTGKPRRGREETPPCKRCLCTTREREFTQQR